MTSSPDPQNVTSTSQKQAASTSPPVSISSQAHLDPACYVKGSHLLKIEAGVVLHPRCRLYTDQGTITIHNGSILLERCIIGIDKELNPLPKPVTSTTNDEELSNGDSDALLDPKTSKDTVIGPRSYLHSSVKLQPPCTIGESAILETGVTIYPNCTIGSHSKVCAGITLPSGTTIPDWTVVYGPNGQMRRMRQANLAEDSRLDSMSRERQGVEALLKMNAAKNLSSGGGGSKSKRESIIRTDSTKG